MAVKRCRCDRRIPSGDIVISFWAIFMPRLPNVPTLGIIYSVNLRKTEDIFFGQFPVEYCYSYFRLSERVSSSPMTTCKWITGVF